LGYDKEMSIIERLFLILTLLLSNKIISFVYILTKGFLYEGFDKDKKESFGAID
jgi:hypothetical protein